MLAATRDGELSRCVHLTTGLHCPTARNIPFVVGIGPAKSGSTAIFRTLASHPRVQVGSAGLRGECCGSELYFFLRPLERRNFNLSWERLGEYFADGLPPHPDGGTRWWGEKTPHYSAQTLVPFLLRAMLPAVRLVYSLRDSLELDASLYAFRGMQQRGVAHLDWVRGRVAAHDEWTACRSRELVRIGHLSDERLYSGAFSVDTVEGIEATLHASCGQGQFRANGTIDAFKEVLNGWNLRRWAFVFPPAQLLCVRMTDHMSHWWRVATHLGRFLGVEPNGFRNVGSSTAREGALTQRDAGATEESLKLLSAAVASDAQNAAWVDRFCGMEAGAVSPPRTYEQDNTTESE